MSLPIYRTASLSLRHDGSYSSNILRLSLNVRHSHLYLAAWKSPLWSLAAFLCEIKIIGLKSWLSTFPPLRLNLWVAGCSGFLGRSLGISLLPHPFQIDGFSIQGLGQICSVPSPKKHNHNHNNKATFCMLFLCTEI